MRFCGQADQDCEGQVSCPMCDSFYRNSGTLWQRFLQEKKSISSKLCGPIPLCFFFFLISGKSISICELEIILVHIWGLVTISQMPFKSMILKINHT